jgi:hypothetical protein
MPRGASTCCSLAEGAGAQARVLAVAGGPARDVRPDDRVRHGPARGHRRRRTQRRSTAIPTRRDSRRGARSPDPGSPRTRGSRHACSHRRRPLTAVPDQRADLAAVSVCPVRKSGTPGHSSPLRDPNDRSRREHPHHRHRCPRHRRDRPAAAGALIPTRHPDPPHAPGSSRPRDRSPAAWPGCSRRCCAPSWARGTARPRSGRCCGRPRSGRGSRARAR